MTNKYFLAVITAVLTISISFIISGCNVYDSACNTGYLSDYSKMQEVNGIAAIEGSNFRYKDKSVQKGEYKYIIVEPVVVQLQKESKAAIAQSKGKLKGQDVNDLSIYLYSAIIDAIKDSGYKIVYTSGKGVAKIRVAITDLRKTNLLQLIPNARITTGVGTGGAAIESELVDSVSGQQILAAQEYHPGSRVPFTRLNDWGGAQYAMDVWVSEFKKQLRDMKNM